TGTFFLLLRLTRSGRFRPRRSPRLGREIEVPKTPCGAVLGFAALLLTDARGRPRRSCSLSAPGSKSKPSEAGGEERQCRGEWRVANFKCKICKLWTLSPILHER